MTRPAPTPTPRRAQRRRRGPLGRVFTLLSWPIALALLTLSLSWLVSGRAWQLDLAANLSAQWLIAGIAATALWAITRRRALAATTLLACLSCAAALAIGRAALTPRPVADPRPVAAGSPEAAASGTVRFLHYNASTDGQGSDIEAFMRGSQADVLAIACPPVRQQFGVIYGGGLNDEYAGKLVRQWRADPDGINTDITAAFVVSRWPMRPFDTDWAGPAAAYLIAGIVERPATSPTAGGEFAVIAVHPRSPRSAQRWAVGNTVVETVGAVARRLRELGLPVVVLTDLNSTPSGHRSHHLFWGSNLCRAKPILEFRGTYPSTFTLAAGPARLGPLPARWPISIAIDDALISPGIEVDGWTIGPRLASEHRPIVIDLRIPPPAAPVAGTTGR